MIALLAPGWLLGLLLVPLMWWLHRASGHGRRVLVPSVLPFRVAAARNSGSTRTPRADPAWWRRAAIAAALALALAHPVGEHPTRRLTVWIDDGPSMGTRESGATRLGLAFEALRNAVRSAGPVRLELRSLGEPGLLYALDGPAPPARRGEPRVPPLAALAPDSDHWLVTDGAAPQLDAWARTGALARVIRVGRATENVGVASLSLRTRLSDPRVLDGTVSVSNAGLAVARRELRVHAGDVTVLRTALELAAGENRPLAFSWAHNGGPGAALEAELTPADALPEDDRLTLSPAAIRARRVRVGLGCPDALSAAVRANPDLAIENSGGSGGAAGAADVRIVCGVTGGSDADANANGEPTVPTLMLIERRAPGSAAPQPVSDALWSETARDGLSETPPAPTLPITGTLEQFGASRADGTPLLRSAAGVLVARQAGAVSRVVCSIDLGDPRLTSEASYPLLVNALLELTIGEPLLARVAHAGRNPHSMVIAPRLVATGLTAPGAVAAASSRERTSYAPLLLVLAAALLLWDLVQSTRNAWLVARAGASP